MTIKLMDIQIIHKSIAYFVDKCLKNLPAMRETQVQSVVWEDNLEKRMTIHSVFLPGKFHGQRSLGPGGLQSMGCKESDMTGQLTHTCDT